MRATIEQAGYDNDVFKMGPNILYHLILLFRMLLIKFHPIFKLL